MKRLDWLRSYDAGFDHGLAVGFAIGVGLAVALGGFALRAFAP